MSLKQLAARASQLNLEYTQPNTKSASVNRVFGDDTSVYQYNVPQNANTKGFYPGEEDDYAETVKAAKFFTAAFDMYMRDNGDGSFTRKNRNRKDITVSVAENNRATLFHGENGLFADCALEREVISSIVTPQGILAILPAVGTNRIVTRVGILTGYDPDEDGPGEPDYPCEDAPTGLYNACIIDFDWGRFARATQTMEFDEIIKRKDAGDTSLALIGATMAGSPATGRLSMQGLSDRQLLNVVVRSEMQGVGIMFERLLSRIIWQGNPANNTAHKGYMEFTGLDGQITTGIVGVDDVPCPVVDSIVDSFELADVCGARESDDATIIDILNDIENYLYDLARKTGILPVTWIIAMSPSLWRELTQCWPCMYLTDRCGDVVLGENTTVTINTPANIEMRDNMRKSMQLPLNGRDYPVILDDGIREYDEVAMPDLEEGQYASTIYFIPLQLRGNYAVTYIEYMDYRSSIASAELSLLNGRNQFWSDDGVYSWTIEQVKWCFTLTAKIEARVLLKAPFLAAKLMQVAYTPGRKVRSPYPGDPTYLSGAA